MKDVFIECVDLQNRLQSMAMTYMQGTPDTMLQEELHKLQVF